MEHDNPQNDPKNWKWGIFYFNPNDRRTIVPKRIPYFGLTVNFASPYAWPILIGSVLLILLLTRVTKLFH